MLGVGGWERAGPRAQRHTEYAVCRSAQLRTQPGHPRGLGAVAQRLDEATVRAVVGICRSCHRQIHHLLTEKQLERDFNTVEKLRAHPGIAKFAVWLGRKPSGFQPLMRSSKAVRDAR